MLNVSYLKNEWPCSVSASPPSGPPRCLQTRPRGKGLNLYCRPSAEKYQRELKQRVKMSTFLMGRV